MQGFIKFTVCDDDEQLDIIKRVSDIFGKILYKVSKFDAHMKYITEMTNYYKFMVAHKEPCIIESALYYLPCMHLLYKDHQQDIGIEFDKLYLQYAKSEDRKYRLTIA